MFRKLKMEVDFLNILLFLLSIFYNLKLGFEFLSVFLKK